MTNFLSSNSELSECVKTIEANGEVTIDDPVADQTANAEFDKWQLRRLSVRDLPLQDILDREAVTNSHVYITDTGIDCAHPDLADHCSKLDSDHASPEADSACTCSYSEFTSGARCDCGEHGTHCAGTVAAISAGWNQHVTLHAVKVLNRFGSGSFDNVIAGVLWSAEHHHTNYSEYPGIISMSLGGGVSAAINQAVERARHDFGVLTVVSAGNSNRDACTQSPASAPDAMTVGASDINDIRASFSNYGSCVNLFGPGVQINSTRPNNRMQYMSGTSMSTPVVVGIASYEASQAGAVTVDEMITAFMSRATKDHIIEGPATGVVNGAPTG